ncbi:MAG: TRAP transporter large permease [Candidatus Adiutrix sp.]|jgi:C4-dicarboxylate transporter DctM subunit|nr:TRAP transporter large permease [Candidatus Adiutrix sp.]
MVALMLILFLVAMFISVPISLSLGMAAGLALTLVSGLPNMISAQMMYTAADSFNLMAIPFFILAGNLMGHGGLSKRLIDFSNMLVGGFSGGLGIIAIITSMFFAAISGSGPATVAALGTILIPGMIKAGYGRSYSSALMATAGAVGIIIPPSIPMILYAVQAEVSVARIFMAGFGPGLIFGGLLLMTNYYLSQKKGYKRPPDEEVPSCSWDVIFSLIMPVLILGGIYGGIFTPTEASGVAVIYGFIVGAFIYRELNLKNIPKLLIESTVSSAVVMLIVMCASLFSFVLISEGTPQRLVAFISEITTNKLAILLMLNIFLLVVGCFLDAASAIIVLTPILLPLATAIGIEPTHFGIIVVVNLAIGLVTPPVGLDLYVACGISKISLEEITKAVWPFLVAVLIALAIICAIPQISLGLPDWLGLK